jgi:hypothetical protein
MEAEPRWLVELDPQWLYSSGSASSWVSRSDTPSYCTACSPVCDRCPTPHETSFLEGTVENSRTCVSVRVFSDMIRTIISWQSRKTRHCLKSQDFSHVLNELKLEKWVIDLLFSLKTSLRSCRSVLCLKFLCFPFLSFIFAIFTSGFVHQHQNSWNTIQYFTAVWMVQWFYTLSET